MMRLAWTQQIRHWLFFWSRFVCRVLKHSSWVLSLWCSRAVSFIKRILPPQLQRIAGMYSDLQMFTAGSGPPCYSLHTLTDLKRCNLRTNKQRWMCDTGSRIRSLRRETSPSGQTEPEDKLPAKSKTTFLHFSWCAFVARISRPCERRLTLTSSCTLGNVASKVPESQETIILTYWTETDTF